MKERVRKLSKNVFVQGGIIFTISNFIVNFINYLFHSLSAKALGPENYSEIAALFSYIVIFTIPLGVVGKLIIQRLGYAGKNRDIVALEIQKWVAQKIKIWRWGIILSLPIIYLLPSITNLRFETSVTLTVLIFFTFLIMFYNSIAQGLHLFFAVAIASIAIALVKFGGAIFAYYDIRPLQSIYIALVLGYFLQFIILKFYVKKTIISAQRKEHIYQFNKRISEVLKQRYVIISAISLITFTFLSNADIIYVKKFYDAQQAGIYSSWSLFAKIANYVSGPLHVILFIFFSTQENKDKKQYLYQILGIFTLIGLVMYIIYSSIGKQLILLIFNTEYMMILPLLPKAALFGYLYTLVGALNFYFIARKSNGALIIGATMPLYLLGLWLYGQDISSVIQVNIIYSMGVIGAYILFLLQEKSPA